MSSRSVIETATCNSDFNNSLVRFPPLFSLSCPHFPQAFLPSPSFSFDVTSSGERGEGGSTLPPPSPLQAALLQLPPKNRSRTAQLESQSLCQVQSTRRTGDRGGEERGERQRDRKRELRREKGGRGEQEAGRSGRALLICLSQTPLPCNK